jgi:uncharacterized OsmC-like protein
MGIPSDALHAPPGHDEAKKEAVMSSKKAIDTRALEQWIGAMKSEPQAGSVEFRTRHRWAGGNAVDGEVEQLRLAGEAFPRRFTFRSDIPEALGGADSGPVPGELIVAALGACVVATFAEKAALEGVAVRSIELVIETEADLRGSYGVAPVRVGLSELRLKLIVDADAETDVVEALGHHALRASPVADTLTNGAVLGLSVRQVSEAREEVRP